MTYRKFKADYLFDGFQQRPGDQVLVCRSDGTIEDLVGVQEAGEGLETFRGILTPGFINCHCHLELSHLKALIPENQGLVNFVMAVVSQRQQTDDKKQEAIQAAESQMLETGIVAAGDICNTADTLKAKSSSCLSWYNFIEVLGWAPGQASSRYETSDKLAKQFIELLKDEKHVSLSPHAPYSVSESLWELLTPGFKGKTITIHNQESAAENEFFLSGRGDLSRMYSGMKINSEHFKAPGTTSLSHYLSRLKTAAKVLLVHNTYMSGEDMIQARDFSEQLFFCFCPNANLYIENRVPDIPAFVKNNAPIVLGTDSLASNHQLSILEEMKTIKKVFPAISTSDMLVWATSNGASALSWEDRLGDFSKGKKPGVVLVENLERGEFTAESKARRIV